MRIAVLLIPLALASTAAQSQQQPSLPDSSAQSPADQPQVPTPDKDGVYAVGEGIEPPVMTHAEPPVFPPTETSELRNPLICILSAVIGVDGAPSQIKIVRGCNDTFQQSAIDSVAHSQFQAGTLNGKPVTVLVHVRVAFQDPLFPNAPRLALHYRELPPGYAPPARPYDTPPRVVHSVEAEFSEQARRAGKEGVVMVSLVIDEQGQPTDIHVTKSAGMGLDEQAVKAVSQYKFEPALKDGRPVRAQIAVEVNFKFYGHPHN